jgi:hypothetical protein
LRLERAKPEGLAYLDAIALCAIFPHLKIEMWGTRCFGASSELLGFFAALRMTVLEVCDD